jgi:hypothetical protein
LLSPKINIQIITLFQLDIIMAQPEPEPESECIKCSEGRDDNCLRYKGYFCKCSDEYHEKNDAGKVTTLVYSWFLYEAH